MTHNNEMPRHPRERRHHDHTGRFEDFGPMRGPKGGRRRRGFGPPPGFGPFGGPGFGPPPGFGPGFGPRGRRGGRGRGRGDVRTAVLVLLAEQPRHGYDLMRAIEERTNGAWSPSPGSIYPTLQSLEDEGLITFETVDGRKTATLTSAGQAWVNDNGEAVEAIFAKAGDRPKEADDLRNEIHGIHEVLMLIGRREDPELAQHATEVLATARKDLYKLLAE